LVWRTVMEGKVLRWPAWRWDGDMINIET